VLRESILALRANKFLLKYFTVLIIIITSVPAIAQSYTPDPQPDYNIFIIPFVQNCHVQHYPLRDGVTLNADNVTATHDGKYKPTRDPLKWWVNCLSYKVTGSPKLIPILFNIGLMPLVYLLTLQLTKDRLVSLIALIAFTNNPLYHDWLSSGTYDQVWSFFLVLSIYIVFKQKEIDMSPITLLLSMAAKSLTAMYLPAWLYTIWKTPKNRKEKITLSVICVGSLLLILGYVHFTNTNPFGGIFGFFPGNWHDAAYRDFEMLWPEVPFLMIFTLLSVNFEPVNPSPYRRLCAIWILNALITTPIIFLFTTQFQFVYRFVPLAVFMSIFIAITINDLGKFFVDYKLNKLPSKV